MINIILKNNTLIRILATEHLNTIFILVFLMMVCLDNLIDKLIN
jgi:hypothetical protein